MTNGICKIFSRGLPPLSRLLWRNSRRPAAQATDYNVGPIQITAPWARATPKGAHVRAPPI